MSRFLVLRITLMFGLILVLAACGGDDQSEVEGDSTEDNGNEVASGTNGNEEATSDDGNTRTLTIAQGADMISFDVHNHSNTGTEAIHQNLFSYLVKYEPEEQEFTPDLAEEWELINDETWEFKLREDVVFHNGDEFTAEDVKFTLERVANDETLLEHENYRQIEEVEIIDDYTVQIHTDGPQPVLLNRLSRLGSGMLPMNYIEENGIDHFLNEPVGTGPYQFVSWVLDDRVTLERFDDYFDGEIAIWDEIVFRSIPEASTRVAEVLSGDVDIAHNIAPADWERVNSNEGTSIIEGPTNRVMMLVPNHKEEFVTSDLKVRQAIDYAIDNETLLDILLDGSGTETLTRIPPENFGADETLYDNYRYDPDRARELLAEAGYEDGLELTLHSPDGRYLQDRATTEVVAGMLEEVGITVNIDFMEWSAFADVRNANEQQELYLIGLASSMWDAAHAFRHNQSNISSDHIGYSNSELDELFMEAEVNMDEDEREQQYFEIQRIADEDLANIMLHQLDNFYAVDDRISFTPRIDEYWRVEDITLSE